MRTKETHNDVIIAPHGLRRITIILQGKFTFCVIFNFISKLPGEFNLLSSNCQTPPTDSNENSQNRICFNATNEIYNAYLVIILVLRVQQYDRSELF